jgi:hypothetical protein
MKEKQKYKEETTPHKKRLDIRTISIQQFSYICKSLNTDKNKQ